MVVGVTECPRSPRHHLFHGRTTSAITDISGRHLLGRQRRRAPPSPAARIAEQERRGEKRLRMAAQGRRRCRQGAVPSGNTRRQRPVAAAHTGAGGPPRRHTARNQAWGAAGHPQESASRKPSGGGGAKPKRRHMAQPLQRRSAPATAQGPAAGHPRGDDSTKSRRRDTQGAATAQGPAAGRPRGGGDDG